ncbi:MAG: primosomal protein N' [Patescibacteria group bacterium]|jgi:primosomal protein N' (replication factor Y)
MKIDIIPEKKTNVEKEVFSYLVPGEMEDQISIGSIVSAPFGKNKIRGAVIGISDETSQPSAFELREITGIDPSFNLPAHYIPLIKWMSEYYLCSQGEALSLFLPTEMKRPGRVAREDEHEISIPKKLSLEQESVFLDLKRKLDSGPKKPALILGVTSSGKTEVYLRLAKEVINMGKQVVVLVPEIVLTPQTMERFRECFGDNVALIHSGLSKSERYKNYFDFYSGAKPIIVGPRSALFVPSKNLGLIILDEEGEGAYKQEKNPKYHAVKVALQLAKYSDALLVMGSATPTIESFYKTTVGEFDLFELRNRYQRSTLPPATIVDLRQEMKAQNYSPISLRLQEEVSNALAKKKQVFLFLNRRGMATFVSCRECGTVLLCPNCAIPLVYHVSGSKNYLSCHHCDYEGKVPLNCPVCLGYKIKYFGAGVEKIESEIRQLFPRARIRRVDSQSLSTKGAYHDFYADLKCGRIDILIGTQIIAKGLDIPSVDLVGIVSADVGLHLPYYKADEKTFQILTQVSGRSGRGENEGKTIIQTYWPEAKSILAAKDHDYHIFYESEIKNRREFGDPPFSHLVRVVAEDANLERAKNLIEAVAHEADKRKLKYIGPAKAFLSRIRNKHRYHIIFKVSELPNKLLTEVFQSNPYLFWDVDPEDLL